MGALSGIIAIGLGLLAVMVMIQIVLFAGTVLLVVPRSRQKIGPTFVKCAIHVVAMYLILFGTTFVGGHIINPFLALIVALLVTAGMWNFLIRKLFDATNGQGTICFFVWMAAGYYIPKLF
jgi:lipopolysaccharide export LptBFGC system permease protein LptF